jgi:hypothetical protein
LFHFGIQVKQLRTSLLQIFAHVNSDRSQNGLHNRERRKASLHCQLSQSMHVRSKKKCSNRAGAQAQARVSSFSQDPSISERLSAEKLPLFVFSHIAVK